VCVCTCICVRACVCTGGRHGKVELERSPETSSRRTHPVCTHTHTQAHTHRHTHTHTHAHTHAHTHTHVCVCVCVSLDLLTLRALIKRCLHGKMHLPRRGGGQMRPPADHKSSRCCCYATASHLCILHLAGSKPSSRQRRSEGTKLRLWLEEEEKVMVVVVAAEEAKAKRLQESSWRSSVSSSTWERLSRWWPSALTLVVAAVDFSCCCRL
jgi:hypothetical protein